MQPLSLEHAIFAALAFSDLFDFPLTAEEIWRNIFFPAEKDVSFFDIIDALENNPKLRECTEFHGGFYFLKGKKEHVRLRLDRYVIAERKYRTAKKVGRVLACLPFVRMVSICNTLGWSNARDESDIDFFIVAARGHLWMTRMLCAGLMHVYGVRPKKHTMKDTICLSFFVSDDALDVSPLFLQEKDGMPDIYFYFWIPYCVPLYDRGGVYENFWKANEKTVADVLPRASCYDTNDRRRVRIFWAQRLFKRCAELCVESLGDMPERMARKFQMRILPKGLRDIVNMDTRVVMNDEVLKFHQEDRREEIRERFVERLEELGVMR